MGESWQEGRSKKVTERETERTMKEVKEAGVVNKM